MILVRILACTMRLLPNALGIRHLARISQYRLEIVSLGISSSHAMLFGARCTEPAPDDLILPYPHRVLQCCPCSSLGKIMHVGRCNKNMRPSGHIGVCIKSLGIVSLWV